MGYYEGNISDLTTSGGGYGNGAWGNDWVLIILFALIFGWGNGGAWGNGGGSQGATDNYVLASDFATIQRQLSNGFGDLTSQTRFIQNGICDGFYAMNTSLLNGFNGVNTAIMQNGYETRNAINGVSSQLADCCCKTQTAIQGVNYNLATQGCAIQNTIQNATRDIVDFYVLPKTSDDFLDNACVISVLERKNTHVFSKLIEKKNKKGTFYFVASHNSRIGLIQCYQAFFVA